MAHIYIIKNSINKKCYIGLTKYSIEYRFNKHKQKSKKSKSALYNAFDKYEIKNFFIESLISGNFTIDELNELEISYIEKYKTLSPNGYNLEIGGSQSKMAEETKKKLSNIHKGRKILWTDKIRIGVKKLWKDKEYRERQTKQRHEKRGKYKEGIKKIKLRKTVNIESIKIDYNNYMTITNLVKKYGISLNTIYRIFKRENIKKRGYKCNHQKK